MDGKTTLEKIVLFPVDAHPMAISFIATDPETEENCLVHLCVTVPFELALLWSVRLPPLPVKLTEVGAGSVSCDSSCVSDLVAAVVPEPTRAQTRAPKGAEPGLVKVESVMYGLFEEVEIIVELPVSRRSRPIFVIMFGIHSFPRGYSSDPSGLTMYGRYSPLTPAVRPALTGITGGMTSIMAV